MHGQGSTDVRRLRDRARWQVGIRLSGLPATARHVALTLATWPRFDVDGVWPSLAAIADGTGLDRRTVMKALDRLETAGWIRRHRGGSPAGGARHPTRYEPAIPEAFGAAVEDALTRGRGVPGPADDQGPRTTRPGAVVHTTRGRGAPRGLQELHKEPTRGRVVERTAQPGDREWAPGHPDYDRLHAAAEEASA